MDKIEAALELLGEHQNCGNWITDDDDVVLREAHTELVGLKQNLKGIEYVVSMASYEEFCPACRGDGYKKEHKPDCWLAKVLE